MLNLNFSLFIMPHILSANSPITGVGSGTEAGDSESSDKASLSEVQSKLSNSRSDGSCTSIQFPSSILKDDSSLSSVQFIPSGLKYEIC